MRASSSSVSIQLSKTKISPNEALDGIHISTGFNKVGMPGKTPAGPDFRTGMPEGIWSGL
jgi:hypothetical protein